MSVNGPSTMLLMQQLIAMNCSKVSSKQGSKVSSTVVVHYALDAAIIAMNCSNVISIVGSKEGSKEDSKVGCIVVVQ